MHAHQVRWLGGIGFENIMGGKRSIADLVKLIATHGSDARKNDSVSNVLLPLLQVILCPGETGKRGYKFSALEPLRKWNSYASPEGRDPSAACRASYMRRHYFASRLCSEYGKGGIA
jgi:hypothetical protein